MKTKQKIEEVEREIEKYKEIYSNYEELSPYIRMRAKLQTLKECEKEFNEFIRRLKEEYKDFEEDIIDLIEINREDKEDLIIKMRRLCKAHKEEIDKIFGDKLNKLKKEK